MSRASTSDLNQFHDERAKLTTRPNISLKCDMGIEFLVRPVTFSTIYLPVFMQIPCISVLFCNANLLRCSRNCVSDRRMEWTTGYENISNDLLGKYQDSWVHSGYLTERSVKKDGFITDTLIPPRHITAQLNLFYHYCVNLYYFLQSLYNILRI